MLTGRCRPWYFCNLLIFMMAVVVVVVAAPTVDCFGCQPESQLLNRPKISGELCAHRAPGSRETRSCSLSFTLYGGARTSLV